MDTIRVCVCANDDDLRAWILDELLLMTWVGALELDPITRLRDARSGANLVIVGTEGLGPGDLDHLHAVTAPVIAVGTAPAGIAFASVLSTKLTSRELKQAIRGTLPGTAAAAALSVALP
jgi:hypothetical protein